MSKIKEIQFKSIHNLAFEVAKWEQPDWLRFRVGTCNGLWRATDEAYEILAVENKKKGNGHLEDVFEWFEHSCRRDGRAFRIREVWNDRFKKHLIEKRGFQAIGEDDVVKLPNH